MIDEMLKDLCGQDLFSSIIETLQINLFDPSGSYHPALDFVETIYAAVLQPLAIMLMIIYFMLAIGDKLSSENFTWQQMGRQMAMFLASFYLINHGFEILELLFNLGLSLSAQIGDIVDVGIAEEHIQKIRDEFEVFKGRMSLPKFLQDALMFVYLMLPWALSWIMGMVVKIICYTRIIEIYARAAWAPVALSDFFHSGFQGAGWRFLKSFLAVCMQGAFILVIAAIYAKLFPVISATSQQAGSFFKFIALYLALMASACMLMFKSLSLSKELLGIN